MDDFNQESASSENAEEFSLKVKRKGRPKKVKQEGEPIKLKRGRKPAKGKPGPKPKKLERGEKMLRTAKAKAKAVLGKTVKAVKAVVAPKKSKKIAVKVSRSKAGAAISISAGLAEHLEVMAKKYNISTDEYVRHLIMSDMSKQ